MKNYRSRGQSGNAAVVVVIVLFLAVVIGVIVYTGQPRREDSGQTLSLAAVERGDLPSIDESLSLYIPTCPRSVANILGRVKGTFDIQNLCPLPSPILKET